MRTWPCKSYLYLFYGILTHKACLIPLAQTSGKITYKTLSFTLEYEHFLDIQGELEVLEKLRS